MKTKMKIRNALGGFMAGLLLLASGASAIGAIVRSDDFSSNTRSGYTDLGIYYGTSRVAADWTVSGGVLNAVAVGRQGMLAIKNAGVLLATPAHFSIAFSFVPTGGS